MQSTDHGRWHQAIERHFRGELSGERASELRDHVRGCSSCELVYERWSRAERALFPASGALDPFAQQRIGERLFGATAPARPSVRPVWIGAALALSAALVLFVARPAPVEDDGFRARSGGEAVSSQVTLRALRIRAGAGGQPSIADLGVAGTTITAGDRLKLLGSSLVAPQRVEAHAITSDGARHELVAGAPVAAGAEDQGLGSTFVVPASWPEGPVKIEATFHGDADGTAERRLLEVELVKVGTE